MAEISQAHLERLEAQRDWAGLIRYWLANGLEATILERALAILNQGAEQCPRYGELARYLSSLVRAT
jgi:hypothetical protein